MVQCPNCERRQVRTAINKGAFWICQGCGGRLANISLLRRLLDRELVERYWKRARRRIPASYNPRRCPICTLQMRTVTVFTDKLLPTLDICKHCQLFWFDPHEYEYFPEKTEDLELVAKQHIKAQQMKLKKRQEQHAEQLLVYPKGLDWQVLFLALGYPIEEEAPKLKSRPWITWILSAITIFVSIWALSDLRWAANEFALIPAEPWRKYCLTFLTAFFLHGDIFHLVGNMFFLLAFGDNVEDYLGSVKYVALLLLATIIGNLSHVLLDPASTIPLLGASGGISGIITFYALRFHRAKLIILVLLLPFRAPVLWLFSLWLVLQFAVLILQSNQIVPFSAAGHLGGAFVGALFWLVDYIQNKQRFGTINLTD